MDSVSSIRARVALEISKPLAERQRSRTNNLTVEQRQQARQESTARKLTIFNDVSAEVAQHRDRLASIEQQHGLPKGHLQDKAFSISAYKNTRAVNSYNAFNHFKSVDLQSSEVSSSVPEGSRLKLRDIQNLPEDEGYAVWNDLDKDSKRAIHDLLEDFRKKKAARARTSQKTIGQYMRHSGERIQNDLQSLAACAQTAALCVIVRTSPLGSHDPIIFTDAVSRGYLEEGLGVSINEFTNSFSGYAISGVRGLASTVKMNAARRKITFKSEIRSFVLEGLREITGNSTVSMSWQYYRDDIVKKYKIQLDGWPADLSFKLDNMRLDDLKRIHDGFENGTIAWRHLTVMEVEQLENDNEPPAKKTRTTRRDKGISHGPRAKKSRRDADKENISCSSASSEVSDD